MMMKVLVPLLALVTVVAVGFVLVELHAPMSHADDTAAPREVTPRADVAPPAPPPVAPPVAAPAAAAPPPVVAPPSDPLDVVVHGKTRREWHAYYADRQIQIAQEIARYQAIVDRAIRGEEPDPLELADAHVKIRELNQRLKEDLEALQQIDAPP